MNQDDRVILTDIKKDFIIEKKQLEKTIHNNLERIQQAKSNIQTLLDKEDIDYKVFSPRKMESQYQEEIDKRRAEKELCEKENQECYKKLNQINKYIEKLDEINKNEMVNETQWNAEQLDKNLIVLNIQEEERQRIARDLHDTSLQNLAHLVHKIELSSLFIDQDPLRAKLELSVVTKNLKSVIEEIRSTIFDLRPMSFDDLGWRDTLDRLLDKLNENREYEIIKDIDDIECKNNYIMVSIYRVIQESLSNAIKHSGGNKIFFSCKLKENNCLINIEDNGKGFSVKEVEGKKERHFGLSVVQERVELMGGKWEIDSQLGRGTKVDICVPLH